VPGNSQYPGLPGAFLVGRTIAGKFELEELIGAGGTGAVYRARRLERDEVVAIKVLHRDLAADPAVAARFHREAKVASRLQHPNLIRVLDYGQEPDGLLYISMDHLDGRHLLRVINDDWPLGTERIIEILSQILAALDAAHAMGVLHRDLKPENVMILKASENGRPLDIVKVCDFGIAKIIGATENREGLPRISRTSITSDGFVVGTPAYMSPEQATGETLDARTDLYSLGVVLYQMLTMCVPFEARTPVRTLLKHVGEEPAAPSTVSSAVDPRLERICLRALRKNPADRFQSAREMSAALRAVLWSYPPREPVQDARPDRTRSTVESSSPPSSTITLPEIVIPKNALPSEPPKRRSRATWIAASAVMLTAAIVVARQRHFGAAHAAAGASSTASSPVDAARVEIRAPSAAGDTASRIAEAIGPAAGRITGCYRAALPEIGGPIDDTGSLHVETDAQGLIVDTRLDGRLAKTSAASCMASALAGTRIPSVIGQGASADIPLVFRSR
jgi:eukaryotic-like serine/threonine-protein kinase